MDKENLTLWYADGFHVGLFLRSNESLVASLKEILHGLEERPEWKVNLEIEAYTLEVLAETEAELVAEMKRQVALGKIEIISGSYAQPLPWVIDGESNIRQLKVGLEETKAALGGCEVITYAVQEPCWSSQLPQLLKGLGFKWCALKNHFGYFGRTPQTSEDKVYWLGPDGSRIEVSPRYSIPVNRAADDPGEEADPSQPLYTANDPGVGGGEKFMRQCYAAGIRHPVAYFIEDIGNGSFYAENPPGCLRFTLWREYFEGTPPATRDWAIGQEDFQLALHWGFRPLSEIARACHAAQAEVLAAESLSSLASMISGAPYPAASLEQAWKTLMKMQHHDPWLVPESKMGAFADRPMHLWVVEWSKQTHNLCKNLVDAATAAIVNSFPPAAKESASSVVVFNPLGAPRKDLAEVAVKDISILNSAGQPVPCQQTDEGTIFVAEAPSFGWQTYQAVPSGAQPSRGRTIGIATSGDLLSLTSPFYEMEIDGRHGACISRMYDRQTARELLGGYGNDFAAYLGSVEGFVRASEQPAKVSVVENGPVRACVQIEGALGAYPLTVRLYLYSHTPRVDCRAQFDFGAGDWIGDTWKAPGWRCRRQSWHIDRKKLQVQFPVNLPEARLYKDAAFEVIESHLQEPFHESWADVKTNTILNWVDVSDGRAGFALFTDRSTSYGYSQNWPLSLILAWGQTEGKVCFNYSIMSHAGTWREAELPGLSYAKNTPLVAVPASHRSASEAEHLSIQPACVLLSAVFQEGPDRFMRFFNASDQPQTAQVEVSTSMGAPDCRVDLMNKPIGPLSVKKRGAYNRFELQTRPFGLETLRFTPPNPQL